MVSISSRIARGTDRSLGPAGRECSVPPELRAKLNKHPGCSANADGAPRQAAVGPAGRACEAHADRPATAPGQPGRVAVQGALGGGGARRPSGLPSARPPVARRGREATRTRMTRRLPCLRSDMRSAGRRASRGRRVLRDPGCAGAAPDRDRASPRGTTAGSDPRPQRSGELARLQFGGHHDPAAAGLAHADRVEAVHHQERPVRRALLPALEGELLRRRQRKRLADRGPARDRPALVDGADAGVRQGRVAEQVVVREVVRVCVGRPAEGARQRQRTPVRALPAWRSRAPAATPRPSRSRARRCRAAPAA